MTTADVIASLNRALSIDPFSVGALVTLGIPANDGMRDDPHIQVRGDRDGSNARLSLVGLLNGVLSEHGEPLLCGVFDSDSRQLLRFDLYKPD